MQFTIPIHQLGWSQINSNLDVIDLIIIEFLKTMCYPRSTKLCRKIITGEEYTWISFLHLLNETPILKKSITTVSALSKRLKKIENEGFIKSFLDIKTGKKYINLIDEKIYLLNANYKEPVSSDQRVVSSDQRVVSSDQRVVSSDQRVPNIIKNTEKPLYEKENSISKKNTRFLRSTDNIIYNNNNNKNNNKNILAPKSASDINLENPILPEKEKITEEENIPVKKNNIIKRSSIEDTPKKPREIECSPDFLRVYEKFRETNQHFTRFTQKTQAIQIGINRAIEYFKDLKGDTGIDFLINQMKLFDQSSYYKDKKYIRIPKIFFSASFLDRLATLQPELEINTTINKDPRKSINPTYHKPELQLSTLPIRG